MVPIQIRKNGIAARGGIVRSTSTGTSVRARKRPHLAMASPVAIPAVTPIALPASVNRIVWRRWGQSPSLPPPWNSSSVLSLRSGTTWGRIISSGGNR